MMTCALPASIPVICGAEGGKATGITGALTADNGLVPISFVAVTKHSYALPLVSPETVIGEVGLEPKDNVSPKR